MRYAVKWHSLPANTRFDYVRGKTNCNENAYAEAWYTMGKRYGAG